MSERFCKFKISTDKSGISFVEIGDRKIKVDASKSTNGLPSIGICPIQTVLNGQADAIVGNCSCGKFIKIGQFTGDDEHSFSA